jgi:L-ribulose-5-phosphate 4-epimerase
MDRFKELKERAYENNMELVKQGLVKATFGNVSCLDSDRKVFAIKPSGVPYTELNPDKIVIVDLDCKVVEGDYNPSSDTKTHAVLYRNFPSIGGIVHTHSTFAVAWAQSMLPIPVLGTTHADHLSTDIPCTPAMSDEAIKGDYENETGNLIVKTFASIPIEEVQMVLVASHGPFTWGDTPEKAVYNSVMLEELAKMAYLTISINPKIKRLKRALIDKHYQRKHGKSAYYGQDAKK